MALGLDGPSVVRLFRDTYEIGGTLRDLISPTSAFFQRNNSLRLLAARSWLLPLAMGMGCDNDRTVETSQMVGNSARIHATLNAELEDLLVERYGSLDPVTMPGSQDLGNLPQSPLNVLTPQKVELGALLYHDTAMAQGMSAEAPNTFSCASCHFAETGFQANRVMGAKGHNGLACPLTAGGSRRLETPAR